MCGICGYVTHKRIDFSDISKMTESLKHRGPDFQNVEIKESAYGNVALGHARLSILDLSPLGNQPMKFKQLMMVFNGEVYNYREIRKELESHNYEFLSDSDSEVILKGFHKWGHKVLDKMIGMFALVIFDEENQKIFMARDRVGVKPLFYSLYNNSLVFGSELRVFSHQSLINTEVDQNSVFQYLHFGYFPEPNTVFKNVFKVKPGHYGYYDLKSGDLRFEQYWDPIEAHNLDKITLTEDEILEELDTLFKSAFNYRMVSDVPVGVFLSGGYDSSLVAAILQNTNSTRIKTFTIGFSEEEFNEANEAKKVASFLGTEHFEYYCKPEDGMNIIPDLGSLYDEPFGDSSAIPTTLLSRFSKEHVSVALSADGGDEIFAGYNNYSSFHNTVRKLEGIRKVNPTLVRAVAKLFSFSNAFNLMPPKRANLYEMATEFLKNGDLQRLNRHYRFQNKPAFIGSFFSETPSFPSSSFSLIKGFNNIKDAIENSQLIDLLTYLPGDILTKVDRATMSVSLEGREPLLDHRIIEYAARIPTEMHFKDGVKKNLLKKVTHKYLPEHLMNRSKKGFGIPVKQWMRKELKDITIDNLSSTEIDQSGIFNSKKVEVLRDQYLNGRTDNFELIWYMLAFQLWFQKSVN